MHLPDSLRQLLPVDAEAATLVARVLDPDVGPCVAIVRGDEVFDITDTVSTVSALTENTDRLTIARDSPGTQVWSLDDVLRNTFERNGPRLIAPIDLHVIKAAGVTFVGSMLERVIEEKAQGNPDRAREIRARIGDKIGGTIASVVPGSEEAAVVKEAFLAEGLWSQYLEVGIGPDPEIFTKAPVLSAVGTGSHIGVLERSIWNNPEPELVLAVTSTGEPVGAMLGNDVNLRDFEGRSALLLTEAKDNNASCSVGPFLRLFNQAYTLDDARSTEITMRVTGREDGFVMEGRNSVREISRSLEELVSHTVGPHHCYPDGFVLFTGTPFAPTTDRGKPGAGFTHYHGDIVSIAADRLGILVNEVTSAEEAPRWTTGITALISNLASRGLLSPSSVGAGV